MSFLKSLFGDILGGAEGFLAGGPVGAAIGFGGSMLGQSKGGAGGGAWSEQLPGGLGGGTGGGTAGGLMNYIIPAFQAYKAYQSNQQLEDLQRQMLAKLSAGPDTTVKPGEIDAANLGVNDASNRQFNDAYSSLGGRNMLGNNSVGLNTALGLNNAQSLMKAREYFDLMSGHRQEWNTSLQDMLSLMSGQREDAQAAGTGLEATLRNIFANKAYGAGGTGGTTDPYTGARTDVPSSPWGDIPGLPPPRINPLDAHNWWDPGKVIL